MEKIPFRKISPIRTVKCIKQYSEHKSDLAVDFNHRCGYCDAHDQWLGGEYVFQIEHFIPKTKFPKFEHEYSNLVYSCPYCNRAKWDDWPSDNPDESIVDNIGYVDPCDNQYNQKFYRDTNGQIIYQDDIGKYIHQKMKFYLIRHSILWKVDILHELKNELHQIRHQNPERAAEYAKEIADLDEEFQDYYSKLQDQLKRNVAI